MVEEYPDADFGMLPKTHAHMYLLTHKKLSYFTNTYFLEEGEPVVRIQNKQINKKNKEMPITFYSW